MKDERGLYYYPFPQNRQVRMYVQKVGGEICFRMFDADDPTLWDRHGWRAHEAIRQASAMFGKRPGGFDPTQAYDIVAARELLGERS